jgi:hypothetical protein
LSQVETAQLTFYFAQQKLINLRDFSKDVEGFRQFIKRNKFEDKRNQQISHKQFPIKHNKQREIYIPVSTIGIGVALAVRFMISIDKTVMGPCAIYLWREVLKKQSKPVMPLKVNFLLLPNMNLSVEIRKKIILEEMKAWNNHALQA